MNKVYFVFIEDKLPKYAIASIHLAKKFSGLKIHLIGNSIFKKQINKLHINFTSIESFYCSKKFEKSTKNINLEKNFRNGFWIKTLERFFILEQFMIKKKIKSIFHAEIDQLLFRCDQLIESINKTNKKGLFVPFACKKRAVASVLFINKLSSLQSMIQSIGTMQKCSNEMELIAKWSKKNPQKIFALPTLATEIKYKSHILPKHVNIITAKEIGGIVDAAQLGMWFGGEDPRNVSIFNTPQTKYIDKPKKYFLSYSELKKVVFKEIDKKDNKLNLNFEKKKYQIYNLHLHSKIHDNILCKKPSLLSLILSSNSTQSIAIKGSKLKQINGFILDYFNIFTLYIKKPSKIYFFFKKRLLLSDK